MKRIITILAAAAVMAGCNRNDDACDASGVFEATEITVSALAQGQIMSLSADEGDVVKAGDVLAYIDTLQLTLRKEQLAHTQQQLDHTRQQVLHTQQQVTHSQSATDDHRLDVHTQLATLQQQLENLRRERVRFESLLAANAASQKQVDDIDYQISTLERQIAATREQLAAGNASIADQSRATASQREAVGSQAASVQSQSAAVGSQIAQVQAQIKDATITAPTAGTILQRYCEAGEYAAPGRALFKLADLTVMTLRIYVTADQYNTLKLGQKVKVSIDGVEKPYEGVVEWIAQRAEFTPKTIQTKDERANLVYAVKVRVKNDGRIKIGMYGDVKF